MIPYLLLLSLPSLMALLNTRRLSLPLWYMTIGFFVLFVGLRDEVGPDWYQYVQIHQAIGYKELWEIAMQGEPLSYMLFWLSQNSGAGVYVTNFVAALIVMIGVASFARRTANPWLALVSATPYFIIVMGMSGIRQARAAGVVLFVFARWEQYSFVKRGIFMLIAAVFHTSALVNNIYLIVKLNIAMRYKVFLGILVLVVTLYLGFEVSAYSDNIERYQDRYLGGKFDVKSMGSLYHIAMIMIPALLGYVFRERVRGLIHNEALLRLGLQAALAVAVLNIFSSTAASRLTIYLYFIPMMIYPALATPQGRPGQMGNIFMVIAMHFVILVAWFQLANVSFAYMPYYNILID